MDQSTFFVKFNAMGEFQWAGHFECYDFANDHFQLITDLEGNIYIGGEFWGTTDFDPGPEKHLLQRSGMADGYLVKLSPQGTLLWARQMGGLKYENISGLAVKSNGNIVCGGVFEGTCNFNPHGDSFGLNTIGYYEMYLMEYNDTGDFLYAISFPTAEYSSMMNLYADSLNDIYSMGYFSQEVDFDPTENNHMKESTGGYDWFMLKISEHPSATVNHEAENGLTVFPNPVTDKLCIQYDVEEPLRLTIYLLDGRCLFDQIAAPGESYIALPDLPSGTLMLKAEGTLSGKVFHKMLQRQ